MKKIVIALVVFFSVLVASCVVNANRNLDNAVKEVTSEVRASHFNEVDREPRIIMDRRAREISELLKCSMVSVRYSF